MYSKDFEFMNKYKSVMGNTSSYFKTGLFKRKIMRYSTHFHYGIKQEGYACLVYCKTKQEALNMYKQYIEALIPYRSASNRDMKNLNIVWRWLPEVKYIKQKADKDLQTKAVDGWYVKSRFVLATDKEIKRSNLNG